MFSFKKHSALNFKDRRQKFKEVRLAKDTKTFKLWLNAQTILTFLPLREYNLLYFFTRESAALGYSFYYTNSTYWGYTHLLLHTQDKGQFIGCIDYCGFWYSTYYTFCSNFANFTTTQRFVYFTAQPIVQELVLPSLSFFLRSIVWLERELRELDGVLFIGLLDTRRLLQDYLQNILVSKDYAMYTTAHYNYLYQDLLIVVKLKFLFFKFFNTIIL